MTKIYLVFVFSTMLLSSSFGQFPFSNGQILFKDGTKVNCQIQLALGYDSLVTYKTEKNSKEIHAKVSEIQTLNTTYNYYDNINVEGTEFLLRRMVNGKAKLYSHSIEIKPDKTSKITNKSTQPRDKKGYKKTKSIKLQGSSWTQIKIIYLVILNETLYVINEDNFMDLSTILADNETVTKKIIDGGYTFNDINQIINDYNQ